MSDKQRLFISPFRQTPAINDDDLNLIWKDLHDAILYIFQQKPTVQLSFEVLYRYAYTLVQNKRGDFLYNQVYQIFENQIKCIEQIIINQDDILSAIYTQWEQYVAATQQICAVLTYLDNSYASTNNKRKMSEMNRELFRDLILEKNIKSIFVDALMKEICKDREGLEADRSIIENICKMLLILSEKNSIFYGKIFESPLLKSTKSFYQNLAENMILEADSAAYLKKAQNYLYLEEQRAKLYNSQVVCDKVMSVAKKMLLEVHMNELIEMKNSGQVACINENRHEDLKRLYSLYLPLWKGLDKMLQVMLTHVKSTGEALTSSKEITTKNCCEYIQQLLDMKDKYDKIIEECFENNRSFQHVLTQGFEHFFNENDRSAEYLSLFIDEKLRHGSGVGVSEEDLDNVLDKCMRLFRLLSAKDLFERYYKQHLMKRLLLNRSSNDDLERGMVVRLKSECGHQYTSKLEGMFLDMKASSAMMSTFKEYLTSRGLVLPIDLSVNVLTTGNWPIVSNSPKCELPEKIKECCEVFEQCYSLNHNGRVLSWLTCMGTADLRATLGSKKHELNVSTVQACILLCYNECDNWSSKQLEERLDITKLELQRYITPLTHAKHPILLKEEINAPDNQTTMIEYKINDKFLSKQYRIRILPVTHRDVKEDRGSVNRAVEEHRTALIEAAIVRVMKSRNTLQHNLLISEVISQLAGKFNPSLNAIKSRIQLLIQREFLKTSDDDSSVYNYVA